MAETEANRSLALRISWSSFAIGTTAVLWFAVYTVYGNDVVSDFNLTSLRAGRTINTVTAIFAAPILLVLLNELRKWWVVVRMDRVSAR